MMDKLQFLALIFAVLLSKLCNVLLCNYKIYLSSFSILELAALRHIRLSGAGDQYESLCQISSKSIKRLQRYGDLTVFKMAAVCHLGFLKFKFFNSRGG